MIWSEDIVNCRITSPDYPITKSITMSSHNGDKSRHQINRKRGVLRRAKTRKLLAEAKRGTARQAPREKRQRLGAAGSRAMFNAQCSMSNSLNIKHSTFSIGEAPARPIANDVTA